MTLFEIVYNGEGEDDGDDGDNGSLSPEHPSHPPLHAPRDNISRKGKSLTPIYIYIYILERLHNESCFRSCVFAWSGVRRCVSKLRDMLTLARELKWSHFLKSLDVWLQQAPDRDNAFTRRGHRDTFENSFGKYATTIAAQAKGVAF